jgi:hypothetical protein
MTKTKVKCLVQYFLNEDLQLIIVNLLGASTHVRNAFQEANSKK